MSTPCVAGVVCDLDGVLRHFDVGVAARLEAECGLAPGTIASYAFSPALMTPAVTGVVTDTAWRDAIAAALRGLLDDATTRRVVTAWSASPGRIDTRLLTVIRQVRQKVPVVILTNATTRLFDDLDALEVQHEFDAVISSAAIGAAKPDPRAYRAAQSMIEELLGRPVDYRQLLFIDDDVRNVEAAALLGWDTAHFVGAPSLIAALRERGLLP